MPTVQISLIREHTAAIRPPRALWVPFILGRPLGVPDDPAFQSRVLSAALKLFDRAEGPVLEDYLEEAPPVEAEQAMSGMACPIDFSREPAHASLQDQVLSEVSQLRSWYDIALSRRGRTTYGLSNQPPDELVRQLALWSGASEAHVSAAPSMTANALRLACEDIKTYYFEARAAQPGSPSGEQVQTWFWQDTAAAKLLFAMQETLRHSPDPEIQQFALNHLIPKMAVNPASLAGRAVAIPLG